MTDDDFDDFRDREHPADKKGPFKCRFCGTTRFKTLKALSLHEVGAHSKETCEICGQRVGIRGKSAHEAMCSENQSGRFDSLLPTEALRARLRDFLERAKVGVERDDVYCLACEEGKPEFVRDVAICERMKDRGMCWIFPANKIAPELFVAPPRRDRRIGPHRHEPGEPEHYEARLRPGGDE